MIDVLKRRKKFGHRDENAETGVRQLQAKECKEFGSQHQKLERSNLPLDFRWSVVLDFRSLDSQTMGKYYIFLVS